MRSVSADEVQQARNQLAHARRIVVKVGSNVLVGSGKGVVDRSVFCGMVEELAALDGTHGRRTFLVSSGAIAVARRGIRNVKERGSETISTKQALAAIGQPKLMHLYSAEFELYQKQIAQVLISPENLGERERFLNARNTLRSLAEMKDVIPIINENDTTSTAEIRIGDNDSLAAQAVSLIDADLLIILSDVDALYDADPKSSTSATRIPAVYADDEDILSLAKPADPTGVGSGGMATKLKAARIAGASGVPTVIAEGRRTGVIRSILNGEDLGTIFLPGERRQARKLWLEFASRPSGNIVIDDGASRALKKQGRSLLSVGVSRVEGDFSAGSPVEVSTEDGTLIGRGLASYSSRELAMIAGHPSEEIESILGFSNGDAVVHRDDFALISRLAANEE
jgi:glutamate 5-kinase